MGEPSKFEPGHRAPNDGDYTEVGEDQFHMGINNPKTVHLKKGDKFPDTSNNNRKWVRVRH